MLLLAIWLSFLSSVHALLSSAIIFPLYIYPADNCKAWTPLIEAIKSNPTLPFIVVINPNSGPGAVGSQPDGTIQSCIQQLISAGNAQKNVELLGYVHMPDASSTAIANDILTYSKWNTIYRPNGIFLDGFTPSVDNLPIQKGYAEQVRQNFGQGAKVALCPGNIPATDDYYDFADLIVTTIASYNQFSTGGVATSATAPARKQAAFISDAPATSTLISQLVSQGIGALFVSDHSEADAYTTIPGTWSSFVDEMTSAQGSGAQGSGAQGSDTQVNGSPTASSPNSSTSGKANTQVSGSPTTSSPSSSASGEVITQVNGSWTTLQGPDAQGNGSPTTSSSSASGEAKPASSGVSLTVNLLFLGLSSVLYTLI